MRGQGIGSTVNEQLVEQEVLVGRCAWCGADSTEQVKLTPDRFVWMCTKHICELEMREERRMLEERASARKMMKEMGERQEGLF